MKDHELVDLQLHKEELEKSAETYYLSATYRYENDRGIYEVTIPKILLPIRDVIMKTPMSATHIRYAETFVDIGFGDLLVLPDDDGRMIYEKLIEEKVHDMTVTEIEKKLGYKIRVVSEKEK